MAPGRARELSIELTTEYEDFMRKLAEYHEKRGTHLDREPKIGSRRVNLLKLYQRVCEEGGYDAMSDTKGKPLAWRRISGEFLPGSTQLQAQAFLVKSAYYKNLAAYEISNFHHREPPPKEILEDVTAKGGGLLQRTIENYHRPISREEARFTDGREEASSSDDDARTPKDDKTHQDEPGTGSGRFTRTLRQQPPQRVIFQPDTSSSRQSRNAHPRTSSPLPNHHPSVASGSAISNGTHPYHELPSILANYEPRQQIPSHVRPVQTPANAPELFRAKRIKLSAVEARKAQYRGMMLPGTGFNGPNIYIRALFALQSGIPEEQFYALHHLVKISHERGDKYRFDGFPGLAEALISKILEVTSLFYNVQWKISYSGNDNDNEAIEGLHGTKNLSYKLQTARPLPSEGDLDTQESAHSLGLINEATLVLRNMILLDENATYASKLPAIHDLLTILLHLPQRPSTVEIRHYALEIAEQLTKFYKLEADDPLYLALISELDSSDRGAIVTSLRALSRISMNLETANQLKDVPVEALKRVVEWLLVEDEELSHACLDFLYQFTARIENVEMLLRHVDMDGLVSQLVRLTMYNAVRDERKERSRAQPKTEAVPTHPPKLSLDIVNLLNRLEEPERSSQWLRTCFEESRQAEVTQIALWQAYQSAFLENPRSRALLTAKDFITNISSTFSEATAQVVNGPVPRYTITGIRPRVTPIDGRGRPYARCQWRSRRRVEGQGGAEAGVEERECGQFALRPQLMWEHIVGDHLAVPRDPTSGKFDLTRAEQRRYYCAWAGCYRYVREEHDRSPYAVALHVKTHLPDAQDGSSASAGAVRKPAAASQAADAPKLFYNTQTDERNDPAGLPLASVLVLRNLARMVPKAEVDMPPAIIAERRVRGSRHDFADRRRASAAAAAKEPHPDQPCADDEEEEEEDDDVAEARSAAEAGGPDEEAGGDDDAAGGRDGNGNGWVSRLFGPVKSQLYYVMAHNLTLRDYIASLTRTVAASEA